MTVHQLTSLRRVAQNPYGALSMVYLFEYADEDVWTVFPPAWADMLRVIYVKGADDAVTGVELPSLWMFGRRSDGLDPTSMQNPSPPPAEVGVSGWAASSLPAWFHIGHDSQEVWFRALPDNLTAGDNLALAVEWWDSRCPAFRIQTMGVR